MKDYFEGLLGKAVAILCARYWWRGVIAHIADDGVIISEAHQVYETGALAGAAAKVEEACATDVFISFGAIESAGQFPWASHGLKKD